MEAERRIQRLWESLGEKQWRLGEEAALTQGDEVSFERGFRGRALGPLADWLWARKQEAGRTPGRLATD